MQHEIKQSLGPELLARQLKAGENYFVPAFTWLLVIRKGINELKS